MKIPVRITAIMAEVTACALLLVMSLFLSLFGLFDKIAASDVAVVLGNKVHEDGLVSARLKARLDKCIKLYNRGCFEKIIVSGAVGKEGVDEAFAMKRYLVQNGIPEEIVIVDSNGRNTLKTAEFTVGYMKDNNLASAMIISQYFHLFRTRMIFKKLGLNDIRYAHAEFFEIRDFYSIAREVAATVKYALM